jgi:hypothetical protein
MKQLSIIAFGLILILSSCKKDKSSTPSGTPVTASGMTALETSLVGQWKLKRTESRDNFYWPGYYDSTIFYTNHYNFLNSQLEFKSTLSYVAASGAQMYQGVFGVDDGSPAGGLDWCGLSGNTISINGATAYFVIQYLTPDSMVLDIYGGTCRLFYNKTNTQPVFNNVESQLSGGTWQLISANGVPPGYPTYRTFLPTWFNDYGYFTKDSIYYTPTLYTVGSGTWEVLFPSRSIPILFSDNGYYKITNLTSTSLQLEFFSPFSSSSTIETDIYAR